MEAKTTHRLTDSADCTIMAANVFIMAIKEDRNPERRPEEGSQAEVLRTKTIAQCKALIDSLEERDFGTDAELETIIAEVDSLRARISQLEAADNEGLFEIIYGQKLGQIYEFLAQEDLEYVKGLQPRSLVMNGSFSLEQRKWIYALFLLKKEDANVQELMRNLQALFGCERYQKVTSVTAWLSPGLIGRLSPDKRRLYDEILDYIEGKKAPEPAGPSFDGEKLDGALFEYDNPVKEAWRRAKMDYLDEQLPREGRDKLKVICLGGRRCLDIPHYLRLGFSPENIISVEREKKIWKEHEASAKRYGIVAMRGDLAELIEQDELPGPFDVIDFDFVGPLSEQTLKTLQKVNTSDRFVAFINVLAAREQRITTAILKIETNLFQSEMEATERLAHESSNMSDFDSVLQAMNNEKLKNIRIGSLLRAVAISIGTHDCKQLMFRDRLNKLFERTFQGPDPYGLLFELAGRVIQEYVEMEFELHEKMARYKGARTVPNKKEHIAREVINRKITFASKLLGEPITTNIKAIKYNSPPHQTPFVTVAMTGTRQTSEEREEHSEFVDFFLQLIEEYSRERDHKIVCYIAERSGSQVTDSTLRLRKYRKFRTKDLTLAFGNLEEMRFGRFKGKVRLDKVLLAVSDIREFKKRDVMDHTYRDKLDLDVQVVSDKQPQM